MDVYKLVRCDILFIRCLLTFYRMEHPPLTWLAGFSIVGISYNNKTGWPIEQTEVNTFTILSASKINFHFLRYDNKAVIVIVIT